MNRILLASIGAAASMSMLATPAAAQVAGFQNDTGDGFVARARLDDTLARIAANDPDAFAGGADVFQRGPLLPNCTIVQGGMAGDPVIPGCQRSAEATVAISTVQAGEDGVGIADDIKILTMGTVETVCTKAQFVNFARTAACTPTTATARETGFTINIYEIVGGLPVLTPLFSYDTDTTGNLTVTAVNDTVFGDPSFTWLFEMDLDEDGMGNGPTLDAGCYAVEVYWDQPAGVTADCGWWWFGGEETNGLFYFDLDGSTFVDPAVERYTACEISNGDQALCVTGSAVFGSPDNAGDGIGVCIDTTMVAGAQVDNTSCDTRTVLTCGQSDTVCINGDDEIAFSAPDVNTCVNSGGDPDTPGFRDIWYSFTPQNANETRVIFDTCGAGVGTDLDNVMAIYTVDPMADPCAETMVDPDPMVVGDEFIQYANLMLIACGDDECEAGDAEVCIAGLEVGREYFIQVFQNDTLRSGLNTFNITCSVPEVLNDDCPDSATIMDAVMNPGTASAPDPSNPYGFVQPPNTIFASSRSGTTQCTGFDPFAINCGADTAVGFSPGVWYVMNVNFDGVLRLTTENGATANFDSQIIVYCGQCEFLICIGGNDDIGADNLQSEFAFCTNSGETYLIYVVGAGETGSYQVQAFRNAGSSGVTCPDDASMMRDCSAEPAQIECPMGAMLEGEICFDSLTGDTDVANDGCNAGDLDPSSGQVDGNGMDDMFYQDLACGDVICGDAQSQNNSRDLDWYEFTLTELSIVTLTAQTEFDGQLILLDSTDCLTNVTLSTDAGVPGDTLVVQEQLGPGTYGIIVSNQAFTGFPCASTLKDYVLSIECEALGSCCTDMGADCIVTTEADCMTRGGSFIAGGTCGNIEYVLTPDPGFGDYCALAFTDISGNPGAEQFFFDVAATEGQNENDDAEFFAIDDPMTAATPEQEIFFPIEFYAQEFDSFFVVSEGFFGFDGFTVIDTDPSDNPLGTAGDSVDRIIAPFWTSQNPQTGGATFWFETAGTAPFRTLTIQYTNIQRFDGTTGEFGDHSYQVIFDESNPCVVFTYGLMSPSVSAMDAPGIQVGTEAFDPTTFTSVDLDLIGAGGTQVDAGGPGMDAPTCFRLCPTDTGMEDPCDGGGGGNFCAGDVNGDGSTTTADITFVVSNLGATGMAAAMDQPPAVSGDANRDGATQTADITFVVSNLGCTGGDTFTP